MNVAGGKGCQCGDLPVFISALRADSIAAKNGKIQEGDILLSINGNSLLGRTHLEAIQTIKSVMSATTVRMELIQGDDVEKNGGLSPQWSKWMARYSSGHQR